MAAFLGEMVQIKSLTHDINSKLTAFIWCFSNIHLSVHTFMAVSTMQGDSQLVGRSYAEVSCSETPRQSLDEPGIELTTFWSPANLLYPLSKMPPQSNY